MASLGLMGAFGLLVVQAKDRMVGLAEVHFWIEGGLALFSCTVAWLGLRGYLTTGSVRLLMLALAFYITGLLDLMADLVAPGGYRLALFAEDGNLSLWVWCVSRIIGAVFLLLSISGPPLRQRQNSASRLMQALLFGLAASVATIGVIVGLSCNSRDLPEIWRADKGHLAMIGATLVLISVVLLGLTTSAYLNRYRRYRNLTLLAFAFGIVALMCSTFVALVSNIFYGLFFWYGDVFQIVGFVAFGFGIVLLRRADAIAATSPDLA